MNKLMLASLSLLLAGAAALPAQAQEQRRWDRGTSGEPGQAVASESDRSVRYEGREERREARRDGNEGGRQVVREQVYQPRDQVSDIRPGQPGYGGVSGSMPPVQQGRGYDRRDDRREARQDDRRDDRRDWRDDRRDDNRYADRYGRNDSRYDSRYDNRDGNRYDNRHDNRYQAGRYDVSRYSRHNDRRWNGNQWYPQYRYRAPVRYVYPRGYRAYQWQVGHRLPSSYYGSNYYVDYNAYRLPPPPYGYHWVRVDRDVVLVSIASGLIRDILYGLYY